MREDADDVISTRETPLISSHLAEPPHVRERLILEIKFFVSYLGKKANGSLNITSANDRDHAHLIDYVTCVDEPKLGMGRKSRPRSSISSKHGRETPLRSSPSGGANGRCVYKIWYFSVQWNPSIPIP